MVVFKVPEKNKRQIFALVDCNQFYVSCERVFQPHLEGKAVGVLSNNDGCLVALSPEMKKMGIQRGMPAFQLQEQLAYREYYLFSSNYTLYGDMSSRVMRCLSQFAPEMEIYSIDEAFLMLQGMEDRDLTEYGRVIQAHVKQWTGIPVSVGIGTSKTLAKLANRVAKKYKGYKGVFNIIDHPKIDKILADTDVEDIWGIGRQYSKKLKKFGLMTALDLVSLPDDWVRKNMTVVGLRTILELKGIPCIELETVSKSKKQIVSSRSFGHPAETLDDLREAMSTFCTHAVERMRMQKCVARQLFVYICTNPFKKDPQYANFLYGTLPDYSAYTPDFIALGEKLLNKIYKSGYRYKKTGVMLTDIIPEGKIQPNLFCESYPEQRKKQIMTCVDKINQRYGTDKIFFAGNGVEKKWRMRREILSPRFTTSWAELPVVR